MPGDEQSLVDDCQLRIDNSFSCAGVVGHGSRFRHRRDRAKMGGGEIAARGSLRHYVALAHDPRHMIPGGPPGTIRALSK